MEVTFFCLENLVQCLRTNPLVKNGRYSEFLELDSIVSASPPENPVEIKNSDTAPNLQLPPVSRCIIIHGLDSSYASHTQVNAFFETSLDIKIKVHHVSLLKNQKIKVGFASLHDKLKVFRNCYKLKGRRIGITEDLTLSERLTRQQLYPVLQDARSKGKSAYFRGSTLIIDKTPHPDNSSSLLAPSLPHHSIPSIETPAKMPARFHDPIRPEFDTQQRKPPCSTKSADTAHFVPTPPPPDSIDAKLKKVIDLLYRV